MADLMVNESWRMVVGVCDDLPWGDWEIDFVERFRIYELKSLVSIDVKRIDAVLKP